MAQKQLLQMLSELTERIEKLTDKTKKLEEQLKELQEKNRELEVQHQADVEKSIRDAKDIEYLSMSYRLAATPETLLLTRRKIEGLIRTINKCIRMINEE